jgi:hypothetical protein
MKVNVDIATHTDTRWFTKISPPRTELVKVVRNNTKIITAKIPY